MKAKYLAVIPVAAFAFSLVAGPAFASNHGHGHRNRGNDIEVKNRNSAHVVNDVEAKSNTGKNDANRNRRSGRIDTGMADSLASASTTANDNLTRINPGRRTDDVEVYNSNRARVRNYVDAKSNTGYNDANNNGNRGRRGNRQGGNGIITTGKAVSTAQAVNMLNSNVTRINR